MVDGHQAVGLYDSGSNVSLLNFDRWKLTNMKMMKGRESIQGVTGDAQSLGTVNLKLKICDMEDTHVFYVVQNSNFKEDVLLGLDIIKKFKLCQDENLIISQRVGQESLEKKRSKS